MNTKQDVPDAREYEPSPVAPRWKHREHTPFARCRNPFVAPSSGNLGVIAGDKRATPVSLRDNRLDFNNNLMCGGNATCAEAL
jgi:hypothetical protein